MGEAACGRGRFAGRFATESFAIAFLLFTLSPYSFIFE